MKWHYYLTFLASVGVYAASHAQSDTVKVSIPKDTLSAAQQEGGVSATALTYYNKAIRALSQNRPDSALANFAKAIDIEPNFARARYNRGALYLSLLRYSEAVTEFDIYIALADTARDVHFYKARALHLSGRPDEAMAAYSKSIERDAHLEESYLYRAEMHQLTGDLLEAETDYAAALRIDPGNAQAWHDRGTVRRLQNRLEAAAEDYNKAIDLDPKMAIAYSNLGAVYRRLGRLDDALTEYNQAVRLQPSNPLIVNNRGYIHHLLGNYEKAEADFRKTLELDAKYAYAHNNLAAALIKQKRYQDAAASASEAIRLQPEYGYAYLNRGIAREMVRDIPGACADWEKAASYDIPGADAYRSGTCKYTTRP